VYHFHFGLGHNALCLSCLLWDCGAIPGIGAGGREVQKLFSCYISLKDKFVL
jgi:hypothetical protein